KGPLHATYHTKRPLDPGPTRKARRTRPRVGGRKTKEPTPHAVRVVVHAALTDRPAPHAMPQQHAEGSKRASAQLWPRSRYRLEQLRSRARIQKRGHAAARQLKLVHPARR